MALMWLGVAALFRFPAYPGRQCSNPLSEALSSIRTIMRADAVLALPCRGKQGAGEFTGPAGVERRGVGDRRQRAVEAAAAAHRAEVLPQ
ncbi:MAG: hypothetical protein COW75_07415 [Rhodobacterales bacterium CG18_big_fil_WC_8_21_14_2_50_71_9]|nr:MAG: hypothetical protein COW75_07415 [Rhodobacterales bacterium CG18_big_fil_WC_8_21_14_2_50_71_9]